MQNRRLEQTGLAKPGASQELTGIGLGLPSRQSVGRVNGRVWNRTDPFCQSKSELLVGYPDLLLTLVVCLVSRDQVSCRQGGSINNRDHTTITHIMKIHSIFARSWIMVGDLLIRRSGN